MIDRPHGDDADLIIVDGWPAAFNEDLLHQAADHHRRVAGVLAEHAHPHLTAAHREAQTRMDGALATRSASQMSLHIADTESSYRRHQRCADELDSFAQTVISTKTGIIGAVDEFTAKWAQALGLAIREGWHQHQYNNYRSELVRAGRCAVKAANTNLECSYAELGNTLKAELDA